METNEKLIEVLNDLIEINNDRVRGYEKAMEETKDLDADLRKTFSDMAIDSSHYVAALSQHVIALGGEPATDSTTRGKIYRAWMDVKAVFTGHDRQAILENCEFGEDAAQRAYTEALATDTPMEPPVRQMITQQQDTLRIAHNLIKRYRDMRQSVNA